MRFIAIEGADCTGKSSLQQKLVQSLADDANCPVIPSKEPGSVDFDSRTGQWSSTGAARIEDHLNTAERVLGLAASMTDNDLAREVLLVAAFVARHEMYPPALHKALLPGGPGLLQTTFRGELRHVLSDWESVSAAFDMSPGLKEQFADYTARDAIRHAILYSSDSDSLPPTATGLMFFADHLLHGKMLEEMPSEAVTISDRTHLSQRAYSLVRGDDDRVIGLYDAHQPIEVDHAIVLTAEEETIAKRADDGSEVGWDTAHHAAEVQQGYRDLAEADAIGCDFTFISTDDRSLEDTTARARDVIGGVDLL